VNSQAFDPDRRHRGTEHPSQPPSASWHNESVRLQVTTVLVAALLCAGCASVKGGPEHVRAKNAVARGAVVTGPEAGEDEGDAPEPDRVVAVKSRSHAKSSRSKKR
jgi:hypothetical protein